jgi:hypothetical protein
MKNYFLATFAILIVIIGYAFAGDQAASPEKLMHATGSFDIKTTPASPPPLGDPSLIRLTSEKQFHGDLEGASRGEMLGAGNVQSGNAGYVALEAVSGTLQGRRGTFILQHSGSITAGVQQLNIKVVPGSGTGDLAGISGSMNIRIEAGGKHFYDFDYALPK